MRFRIKIRTSEQPEAAPLLFRGVVLYQRPRWTAFLLSLSAHAAVLFFSLFLADRITWFRGDEIDWSAYTVEPIRMKIPERIYFRANAPARKPQPLRAENRPNPAEASASQPAAPLRPLVLPNRLQLPATDRSPVPAPLILQPEFHRTAVSAKAVPPLAFWARQSSDVPRPPRKQLIIPGRTEDPSPPNLSAPPVLAIPNKEPNLSDINIAAAPPHPSPALPVAPSSTTPIRLRDSTAEARNGSVQPSMAGQASNLIAISSNSLPADKIVTVPRGLRNLPSTEGETAGPSATSRPSAASSASSGPQVTGQHAGGKGAANGSTSSNDHPAGRNGTPGAAGTTTAKADTGHQGGDATGNHQNGSGTAKPAQGGSNPQNPASGDNQTARNGAHTQERAAVSSFALTAPPDPGQEHNGAPGKQQTEVTRMAHPINGAFDVVVMQSGNSQAVPETVGLLAGSPVYTVYLNVGAEREWLLQYCSPASAPVQRSTYEVTVDDASPVAPPYPITTVIPNSVLKQHWANYIVLHAYLTASGKLRDISATNPNDALARQIMGVLDGWVFRPAMKQNKPVDVEVVLAIPPRA